MDKTYFFLLIIALFFFLSEQLIAGSITIHQVNINCSKSYKCESHKKKWSTLKKTYEERTFIKEAMKLLILEGGVKKFSYNIAEKDNRNYLNIDLELYPYVNEVRFIHELDLDLNSIRGLIPLKENHIFLEDDLAGTKIKIEKFLKERGYGDFQIESKIVKDRDDIDIELKVVNAKLVTISEINIDAPNKKLQQIAKSYLKKYTNAPYNIIALKGSLDDLSGHFVNDGMFFAKVEITKTVQKDYAVKIFVKVDPGYQYGFTFRGNRLFSVQELRAALSDLLKKGHRNFGVNLLKKKIDDLYQEKGILDTKVDLKLVEKSLNSEMTLKQFDITIEEGIRTKIEKVNFYGNYYIRSEQIEQIFYENASDLVKGNHFDELYLENFTAILKNYYIKNGFIFAEINGPMITFLQNRKKVVIDYKILEKNQVAVDEILVEGVEGEEHLEILKLMENKQGREFNAPQLIDDLQNITLYLKNQGYYYCEISNEKSKDMVTYDRNYRKAMIKIVISLGPKIRLGNIIITGNAKTKNEVILREFHINSQEIITPQIIDETHNRLLALGLFSSVNILLIKSERSEEIINLLVVVEERDSGIIEIAPGYRDDMGIKLSGSIGYNNLMGMNRGASFKGELNQRLDYSTFDRVGASTQIWEYSTTANYVEPYFLNYPITFQNSVTYAKKRYFSFDAFTLSEKAYLSKSFSKVFSASTAYQLDSINTVRATEKKDQEVRYLRIGSLIPGVTFDWRDNPINTTKGFYWGVNCQWANPYFYSQKTDTHEINFYKLTSRQVAYLPMPGGVFTISLFGGIQENLVKESSGRKRSIPTIALFRLNGIDGVRGFSENEINMLLSENNSRLLEKDIAKAEVLNKAHILSIKVEPRFYLGDDMVLAPFFDAGRVYLDRFNPFKLRSSVGLAFKYLTPMGALEISYGLKIKRRQYNDGRLENPGDFALSIGIF